MINRKAAILICAGALLAQSCVQYTPAADYPPTPQPPYPSQYAAAPASQPAPQDAAPSRADSAIEALVAPIALYPDPLIALILPASTVPADLSAAAAYLVQYGDMTRIDSQPWDPSVRGLAHYPTVVAWMAENMPWTQALGSAFISSPSAVMDAVQRLRARALAAGTLASTPQQQVYSDGGVIYIYPAQPDSVYIPAYDDSVVYSDGTYYGYGGPFINFGQPYLAGAWLSFYFDWGGHRVWSGGNVWREHRGWQPPNTGGGRSPPGAKPWHPSSVPGTYPPQGSASGNAAPRPRPMPGAPIPPPPQYRSPAQQGQAEAAQTSVPVPRTAAPPLDRPRLNSPGTVVPPGAYAGPGESETHYSTPQEQPRSAEAAPARQLSPAPAGTGAPPAAPHSAPAHGSAPAPAPAPAPAQDGGRQEPQK
jgi:uncharacterized protein DUF3300